MSDRHVDFSGLDLDTGTNTHQHWWKALCTQGWGRTGDIVVNIIDRDTQMCISLASRPGNHGNRFHNFLYDRLGLNMVYKSFSSTDIGASMGGVRSLGIRGVGVSMPYKESCMPFLDHIDPSAAAIDSVNTIVNDAGVLTGYNTDFIAVESLLKESGLDPTMPFALLGAGGMGKAVVAALVATGFHDGVILSPRSAAKGEELARRYQVESDVSLGRRHPRLLLNATPIGMEGGPGVDELAFDAETIRAVDAVFDVVYLPPDTPLIRLARSLGKKTITGDQVMARQALEQFVLYTGVRPTPEQVRAAEEYANA